MNCNQCGKEMTKELSRVCDSRAESWWCPLCGSSETTNSDKKKSDGVDKKKKPKP